MVYMGSKRRVSKHILPIMLYGRRPDQYWVEPFVGGANTIDNVNGLRIGADANRYLISLYNALKSGYLPPRDISEGEYNFIRSNRDLFPPYVLGYYGFAITFGAKWFASFARNKRGDRYDHRAYNSIKTQAEKIKDITFIHSEYQNLYIPPNSKIYCDPPYEDTEGYDGAEVHFNHSEFWQWCRCMVARGHEVFVSEYNAPDDFICLWEGKINNAFSNKKSYRKALYLRTGLYRMIYLAGPYTHPDEAVRLERYEKLTAKAAELMKDGHVVFSPITHGHAIAVVHDLPTDFAWWGKQCLGMLRHADKITVLALPGYTASKGVNAEIQYAETIGIPIEYLFTID